MLSFLIPTYNFDCLKLINDIFLQCIALQNKYIDFEFEIVVVDDGSPNRVIVTELERGISTLQSKHVRLVVLPINKGYAAVRNILLNESRGEWVVFMDSDAEVVHEDFVETYWQNRNLADVVIGGIVHPHTITHGYELRLMYEHSVQHKRKVEWRSKHPYSFFSAFNLLAHRSVFMKCDFDERCNEYGYEDALMAMSLQRIGVSVVHIDNTLLHTGIDRSDVFLKKTETAMRTLSRLPEEIRMQIGVAKWARCVKQCGGNYLISFLFRISKSRIRKQLLGRKPSMILFQFYKLCFLMEELNKG